MKVILLDNVAKVGKRYEVVNVKEGYAINALIPRGLAREATVGNLKALQSAIAAASSAEEAKTETYQAALAKLDANMVLEIKSAANEKGTLFSSVDEASVLEALKSQGIELSEDHIKFETVKEVGEYDAQANVGDTSVSFKVSIVTEE